MFEKAKKRLETFGYAWKVTDEAVLTFSLQKAENTVKNDCNVSSVPEGLVNIVIDMAAGEFLIFKKTFSPCELENLDLSVAVKQIQEGDTSITFAAGEGSKSDEQRLDTVISWLLSHGRDEFSCYRKIRW